MRWRAITARPVEYVDRVVADVVSPGRDSSAGDRRAAADGGFWSERLAVAHGVTHDVLMLC